MLGLIWIIAAIVLGKLVERAIFHELSAGPELSKPASCIITMGMAASMLCAIVAVRFIFLGI